MNLLAGESFARFPWRITEAFTREELTRDEYLTLTYLTAKLSRERDGFLVTELAVVKAETNWSKTNERLRQLLEHLVELGWIRAETSQGSRKWRIVLRGAAIVLRGEQIAESGSRDLEVTSKADESVERLDRWRGAKYEAVALRNAMRDLEVDTEIEVDQHQKTLNEERPDDNYNGSYLTEGNRTSGVLIAINRARVHRGEEPLERSPSFAEPISALDEELLDRIGDEVFAAPAGRGDVAGTRRTSEASAA